VSSLPGRGVALPAPFECRSFSRSFQPGFPGRGVSSHPCLLQQEPLEALTECRRGEKPRRAELLCLLLNRLLCGGWCPLLTLASVPRAEAAPRLPGEGTCEGLRCHRKLWGGWSCCRGEGLRDDECGGTQASPGLLAQRAAFTVSVCWLAAVEPPDLAGEIIRQRTEAPEVPFLGGRRVWLPRCVPRPRRAAVEALGAAVGPSGEAGGLRPRSAPAARRPAELPVK